MCLHDWKSFLLCGKVDSCVSILSDIRLRDVDLEAAAFCQPFYVINNTTMAIICMVSSLCILPSLWLARSLCLSFIVLFSK